MSYQPDEAAKLALLTVLQHVCGISTTLEPYNVTSVFVGLKGTAFRRGRDVNVSLTTVEFYLNWVAGST